MSMEIEIKEINNKEVWENFLLGIKEKTFLQSWNWGEFQKMMGNKIWRLGIYNKEELSSVALAVKVRAKRGTFLMLQHCLSISEILLSKLKEIAKKENCSFIRVAPLIEKSKENIKLFKDLGFHDSPMHANAYEASLKLDLTPSEERLLKSMRKTTRYLIRKAEKNSDIEIFQSQNQKDLDIFYQIHQEVVRSQKFTPFSLEYLKKEFLAFLADNQVSLFFGKYQGKIIASAFVIFWSNIGFYHHAALLPQYHKIPIAPLILWEAIKEAKKRGCQVFDFWGYVDPFLNPTHPWAGPTFFKMGFGGKAYQYLKTQDFPLLPKYWLTYLFEKLRKIKRGL